MNLRDVWLALRRRWYVAVAGLLLTCGLAAAAFSMVPASFTATTSVLLVPPKSTVGPRGNPYMNLGGLAPALDVLTARMLARPSTQALLASHPDAEVTVGPDSTTTGPILLISVTARTPESALDLRSRLSAEVAPTLKTLQDELAVPDLSRISIMGLATDPKPERDIKDQLRAAIVAVAGGLGGTALTLALVDKALARRTPTDRRSRRRSAGETSSADWWDDGPAPEDRQPRLRDGALGTGSGGAAVRSPGQPASP